MILDRLGRQIVVGCLIVHSVGIVVVVTSIVGNLSGASRVYGVCVYGGMYWSIDSYHLWIISDNRANDWEVVGEGLRR